MCSARPLSVAADVAQPQQQRRLVASSAAPSSSHSMGSRVHSFLFCQSEFVQAAHRFRAWNTELLDMLHSHQLQVLPESLAQHVANLMLGASDSLEVSACGPIHRSRSTSCCEQHLHCRAQNQRHSCCDTFDALGVHQKARVITHMKRQGNLCSRTTTQPMQRVIRGYQPFRTSMLSWQAFRPCYKLPALTVTYFLPMVGASSRRWCTQLWTGPYFEL